MAKGEHWYVLRVQSGFGTFLVSELRKNGIPVFLTENHDSGALAPALGRVSPDTYVFARFSTQNQKVVVTLPGFVCIAGVPQPVAVPDANISDLQAAVGAGLDMTVLSNLRDVQRGRILDGPLNGRRGNLLQREGVWHFAVAVPPLDRTFAFSLPNCSVELDPVK